MHRNSFLLFLFLLLTLISSNIFAEPVNFILNMDQKQFQVNPLVDLKNKIYEVHYTRTFSPNELPSALANHKTFFTLDEAKLLQIDLVGKFIGENAKAKLMVGNGAGLEFNLSDYVVSEFSGEKYFKVEAVTSSLDTSGDWKIAFTGNIALERILPVLDKERYEDITKYKNPYYNDGTSFQIDERHFRHERTTNVALPGCKTFRKKDTRCKSSNYFCSECYTESRTDHVSYEVWVINPVFKNLVSVIGDIYKKSSKKYLAACNQKRATLNICKDPNFECSECMYLRMVKYDLREEIESYGKRKSKYYFNVFSK